MVTTSTAQNFDTPDRASVCFHCCFNNAARNVNITVGILLLYIHLCGLRQFKPALNIAQLFVDTGLDETRAPTHNSYNEKCCQNNARVKRRWLRAISEPEKTTREDHELHEGFRRRVGNMCNARRVEEKGTAKFHLLLSKYKSLGLNNLSPVEKCCFDLEV